MTRRPNPRSRMGWPGSTGLVTMTISAAVGPAAACAVGSIGASLGDCAAATVRRAGWRAGGSDRTSLMHSSEPARPQRTSRAGGDQNRGCLRQSDRQELLHMASPALTIELTQRSEDERLLLNADERDAVLAGLTAAEVRWAPTPSQDRWSGTRHGPPANAAWLETLLLMFASGMVGAISTDAWTLMKRAASRVFTRQSAKTYKLQPKLWVVLQDGDDRVAINPVLPFFFKDVTEAQVLSALGEAIDPMDWTALRKLLDELRDQDPSPGRKAYEAIYQGNGEWRTWPHPTLLDDDLLP